MGQKRTITIDLEVDVPFINAEQERFVLASIEDALEETAIWHELLCNPAEAPQKFSKVRARFDVKPGR